MNEPVWFRQNRDASDRFAAVLDGGADTISAEDEFADELALVGMLQAMGSEPVLEPSRRERMRAELLAEAQVTPLALSEKQSSVAVRRIGPPSRRARRKASLWAAATAAGVVAFGALGIELAQTALPGDLLYDIKRTTEAISLDLTFSEDGRALKQLDMAATRVDELAALTERDAADGGASVDEVADYRAVIADLNSTAAAASRAVTSYGPATDGTDLRTLRDWAGDRVTELNAIKPAVPGAVLPEFTTSVDLMGQIEQRAAALLERLACERITSGQADRLGALPADGLCEAADGTTGVGVLPRASAFPNVVDDNSSKAGQEKPSVPAGGSGDGEEPSSGDPAASQPTGAVPPPVQLPGLPTGDDPETPKADAPASLPALPLLTELPEIDLGLG